jgi:hypothetical protein
MYASIVTTHLTQPAVLEGSPECAPAGRAEGSSSLPPRGNELPDSSFPSTLHYSRHRIHREKPPPTSSDGGGGGLSLGGANHALHGPQLHHQVTLHAFHPLQQLRLYRQLQRRRLTRGRNRLSNPFHAPTQRRAGRECVPCRCEAVRMCACHGFEQGHGLPGRY